MNLRSLETATSTNINLYSPSPPSTSRTLSSTAMCPIWPMLALPTSASFRKTSTSSSKSANRSSSKRPNLSPPCSHPAFNFSIPPTNQSSLSSVLPQAADPPTERILTPSAVGATPLVPQTRKRPSCGSDESEPLKKISSALNPTPPPIYALFETACTGGRRKKGGLVYK